MELPYTLETKLIRSKQLEVLIKNGDTHLMTVFLRPYHFYKDKKLNFSDMAVPSMLNFYVKDINKMNELFGDFCSNKVLQNDLLKEALLNALIILIQSDEYDAIVSSTITQDVYDFYMQNSKFVDESCPNSTYFVGEKALQMLGEWNVDYEFIKEDHKDKFSLSLRTIKLCYMKLINGIIKI